ncbi:MAG: S66 peptidase family protein [Patescibacteria group bacterium]
MFPKKLETGDLIRVIAPSQSLSIIASGSRSVADRRFGEMGLNLTFGKHVDESDLFYSSSIEARIKDFHEAFNDETVKAIFAVIGGFNANQLLRYIDWELLKQNPKIFCGYSDTTALQNALFAKTGLVTYSGPAYSTFGQELYFDYTSEYFKKCIFSNDSFEINPSEKWTDDRWWENQLDRNPITNSGWLVAHEGEAEGTILGGNLCTLNLLQGTEYFPDLNDSILFLEDDEVSKSVDFDRDLQSLIHQPSFTGVRGFVIGRFQKTSNMTDEMLANIIASKKELSNLPIIANVDFGHTSPMITFPIGGTAHLRAKKDNSLLKILKH